MVADIRLQGPRRCTHEPPRTTDNVQSVKATCRCGSFTFMLRIEDGEAGDQVRYWDRLEHPPRR
jgi:hypothetical protein